MISRHEAASSIWTSLLLIALAACSGGRDDVVEREGEPDFAAIDEDDAEMNAAMRRGRSTSANS